MTKLGKNYLREQMLTKRNSLSSLEIQGKSHETAQRLLLLPEYRQAKTVLIYLPTKSEINTLAIIQSSWQQHKNIVIPVCQSNRTLLLSKLNCFADLAKGTYDILEPVKDKIIPIDPQEVDLAIVPGLAFDEQGTRLGYGGGYFDRFLKTLREDCPVLALCYEFQVIKHIPTEVHDVPVDMILTEEGLHKLYKH